MRLGVHGHPLHTRSLTVELRQQEGGRLGVQASVVDVRKRGFVPVAALLQPSGLIHYMTLEGEVEPATGVIAHLTAHQHKVAFEPSVVTRGESCRDLVERVGALAGAPLDAAWPRRVSAEIGGPRGCSHLLTLGQLLGATVRWALDRERELYGCLPSRPVGQRVFRRDVLGDGFEPAEGRIELGLQLIDLHEAPGAPATRPMDRFGGAREVHVRAAIDFASYSLAGLEAAERWRPRDDLDATWRDRTADVAGLAGTFVFRGVTAAILGHVGDREADRPLRDLLVQIGPMMIVVNGAISEQWVGLARAQGWFLGMSGIPDSCYMWRAGGALARARTPNDPTVDLPAK